MKINRKLILILVLIVCMGIVGGCSKTPDNFDKDLWQDSMKVVKILYTTYERDNNFSVKDEKVIEEYFEVYKNRGYDNIDELALIKKISEVYKSYTTYTLSVIYKDEEKEILDVKIAELQVLLDKIQNIK